MVARIDLNSYFIHPTAIFWKRLADRLGREPRRSPEKDYSSWQLCSHSWARLVLLL